METTIVNERKVKNQAAEEIIALENLIKEHITGIGELIHELRENREMFNDSFNNDPVYREHNDKVKEATRARGSVKVQITKQPSVALLNQKVKDLRFDLNEKKKTLSDLLLDYQEKTAAKQLELFDGQIVEIVQTAKIVRKRI